MKKKSLKWIFLGFLLLLIPFLLYLLIIPDVSKLKKENPRKTAFMEYREKEWKEKGRGIRIHQTDDKFWRHEGFDYEAIRKAIERDLRAKRLKFGGSTISQQLARNLYLSPEKSLLRKMSEALITWRMETILSKRRILELYLNVVEWGEGIFGIEAASRHYYGKPSSQLTPLEATRLAAVLPSPKKYNPVGDQRYVATRANDIYNIMIQRGIILPDYQEVTDESEPSLTEGTDSDLSFPKEEMNLSF